MTVIICNYNLKLMSWSEKFSSFKRLPVSRRISLVILLLVVLLLPLSIFASLNQVKFRQRAAELPATPPVSPTPVPTLTSRVFITSLTYSGNLGGLSGADAKCQERANAANLGGAWKAWLSDSETSATNRLYHSNSPYQRIDGTIIANNWEDLVDGALQNKINITELGKLFSADVWTNTNTNGTTKYSTDNATCGNWKSSSSYYSATGGRSDFSDKSWTDISYLPCNSNVRLYCFEQLPKTTPTPTAALCQAGIKLLSFIDYCGYLGFRTARFTCLDNFSDQLGTANVCKSITQWVDEVAIVCNQHPLCSITPTATRIPNPTIAPTNTPFPTPTPELPCSRLGTSVLDQQSSGTSTAQALVTGWGVGEPLTFIPTRDGKLDKIALSLSYETNGEYIQVKVTDQAGNTITEVITRKVTALKSTYPSGRWEEFDFNIEPILKTGNKYTITFRKTSSTGNIYVHRGSSWAWGKKIYLKPCLN